MPVQDGEGGYPSREDGEVHQIGKAVHNGHPYVVEDDREPQRLFLNCGKDGGKFVRKCLAESGPPRLIPRERFRSICLRCLPNEQARHLCAARSELLNRLPPRLARVAVLLELGPACSQQLGIGD